jgi:exopolysaccharide production protein ExoQ
VASLFSFGRRLAMPRGFSVLVGLAGFIGPLLYFAPLSAPVILILLTLVLGWIHWRKGQLYLPSDLAWLILFVPLLAWMGLSAIWSLNAEASLLLACRIAAILILAVLFTQWFQRLSPEVAIPVLVGLAWGLLITTLIVLIDHASGWFLLHLLHRRALPLQTDILYSRGFDFHALIAVPLALGLYAAGHRKLGIGQLLIVAAALLIGTKLSPFMAILWSAAAAALVATWPRLRWLLPLALILGAAFLPFIFPINLPEAQACWLMEHKPSAVTRITIWNFTDMHIRERPITGWGLDAARRIPHGIDQRPLYDPCTDAYYGIDRYLPLHPHNGILQVWLELGGVGAFLGFGAIVILMARGFTSGRYATRQAQAIITSMLAPALSIACVSFGIWQEWWLSTLAMAVIFTLACASIFESKSSVLS